MIFTTIKKYSLLAAFSTVLIGLNPQIVFGQVPTEKSLMWEISGNGIKKPSYLFGTIHRACVDRLVFKPKHKKVLDNVQQLYLEIDISDASVSIAALAGTLIPGGRSLKDVMSDMEYRKVKNFFENEQGVPFWTIRRMRPLLLLGSVLGSEDKCQTNSWEVILGKLARKRAWKIKGLETAQEQMAVFDRISIKDQVKLLVEAIDNRQKLQKQSDLTYQELQNAYHNQDIVKLYSLVVEETAPTLSSTAQQEFATALLDERNKKWIPIIGRVARDKPTFFGVGAGHLGGKRGVIALLRQAGYTVKPVFAK
jgi:uncharacterized protein YbaP (TraB family)